MFKLLYMYTELMRKMNWMRSIRNRNLYVYELIQSISRHNRHIFVSLNELSERITYRFPDLTENNPHVLLTEPVRVLSFFCNLTRTDQSKVLTFSTNRQTKPPLAKQFTKLNCLWKITSSTQKTFKEKREKTRRRHVADTCNPWKLKSID